MKFLLFYLIILSNNLYSQNLFPSKNIELSDSLQGSNTKYRNWWDVTHYNITVHPNFNSQSIKGSVIIKFNIINKDTMQIDLQEPMRVDSIINIDNKNLKISFIKQNNFYFINLPENFKNNTYNNKIQLYFSGKPKIAATPPWDGGWIFTKDESNLKWMTVACEGIGASIWFPCKDYLGDKPEKGAILKIISENNLKGIGNGKLIEVKSIDNKHTMYTWEIINPINNYNIIPYIGNYVNFKDSYSGENGILSLNYWVLPYNLKKAKKQFKQVKKTLEAFEYWFGPYPFYEDGYKLVETPYLGMEHQSAIAYGNKYLNGYLGTDRSGTGVGLLWDFIIVHESGHEWFGNNITNTDIADMWIHEAFTTYSETLFIEYFFGKEEAYKYIIGQRKNILNNTPIIRKYNIHQEGSSDMYDKGANMIHTIRQIIGNDEKFRKILRGLNKEFQNASVTSEQIENYISANSAEDLSKVFDQYLRTTKIPCFEYYIKNNILFYRWINVIKDFNMKIRTSIGILSPTTEWQSKKINSLLTIDPNYYIKIKNKQFSSKNN